MAISKDDLHLCISKSMQFLKNSAWTFIKHHPFVSFTLLVISFLYLVFPFFFWALIHFLAFLIFLVSITSLYSNSKSNPQFKKSPLNADSSNHDPIKNRNGRPFVRARSVRQRKSRDTSRTSSKQNSKDEKNPCIQQQEQNPKEINGDNIETESSSSSSSESEESEKNKGVEWTKDDEKNLMDLGFSEMERNKRLESLIARRRSRKMFSLQIRKALLNKDISVIPPPIAILKTKPFAQQLNTIGSSSSYSGQVSPTPGSAPPVLLPAYDPFDLPYDPFEEKPVLTGGSFHQEFNATDLHDAVLRRHESFCLGTIGEFKQDEHVGENPNHLEEKEDTYKIIEVESSSSCRSPESNFKNETKSDQYITEEIQSPEKRTIIVDEVAQETENAEIETKFIVVDNPSYMSSSTSSDEDDPPFARIDKEAILKSLTFPNPRSFSLNNNYDATLMNKVIHHKPTHSIASDMQVEVSEIGSPPQMIDGSFSSFDIGSPIEEEDDINYGNECLWELSSQISVNYEDAKALNEIYRLHDEYTIKQGSSRCKQSKDSGELHDLVKDMEEQDVGASFSRPDDLCNGSHEHVTHESSQPFISSEFPDVENRKISTETDTVFRFRSDEYELLEEPSIPSTISTETNSFSSNIEPRVDDHETRQKETMEVPQNTSKIIDQSDTITDLHIAIEEEINPSILNVINNITEDSSDLVNQSNRQLLDTQEASNPSTSSMEAEAISLPKRTDFNDDEHEGRRYEHREITQSTSTRINNLETMASTQQPYKEHESSSCLDESNHESEDHNNDLARPGLANHNQDIDTQESEPEATSSDRKKIKSSMESEGDASDYEKLPENSEGKGL